MIDAKIDAFLINPAASMTGLQAAANDCKHMFAQSQKIEFAGDFGEAAKTLAGRIDRTVSAISKVIMGNVPQRQHVPKLLKLCDKQHEEHASLKKVAVASFAIDFGNEKPAKRKRTGKQGKGGKVAGGEAVE